MECLNDEDRRKAMARARRQRWVLANPQKQKASNQAWRERNRAKYNAAVRRWAENNRDKGRESQQKYAAANPERVKEKQKQWQSANLEYMRAEARKRYWNDPAKGAARYREWHKQNPDKARARGVLRKARKRKAAPGWLSLEQKREMVAFYREAKALGLQVDHRIPLAGCLICQAHGLHVPWNLQLISADENYRKHTRCDVCLDNGVRPERATVMYRAVQALGQDRWDEM